MEEGDGDGQSRSLGFPATLVGDVRWEPEISAVAATGGRGSGGFFRTPDIEHEPRKGCERRIWRLLPDHGYRTRTPERMVGENLEASSGPRISNTNYVNALLGLSP